MYKVEKVTPYNSEENKSRQVESMFDSISGVYDRMNRLMTMRSDLRWRRKAIEQMRNLKPRRVLDVATGTADFAILCEEMIGTERITGIDISEGMMSIGRRKIEERGYGDRIELKREDCLKMPYGDGEFDAVMSAFGVRNFSDIEAGIGEMCRVTRKGGMVVILEMSEPYTIFKPLYWLYTRIAIPIVGRLMSHDKGAYGYLPESIGVFPHGKPMTDMLERNGMGDVRRRRMMMGACSLYTAVKK